ncbi:MAG: DUF1707 domain-containing protein [Gemmatimonadetes bacterium]|nr:DUF1707 domain-containing protein [Gemmatimonadota bacterium]
MATKDPVNLELERERTVQVLCAHYAQDHLTTQELEARFEEVYRAPSREALQGLLTGLPALPATATPAAFPMYAVAPAGSAPREKRLLALMAEVNREGAWVVPTQIVVRAIMGSVRLDLREVQLPEGGVDIDATAVMGEVRIILPPGVRADVDGLAIMGEFTDKTRGVPADGSPPMVRVQGTAVMGGVRVEMRLPREGALEAWKRRLLGR